MSRPDPASLCADWQRLDLVKIDAEGAELLVWEGMRVTRERFPQAAIVMELHLPRERENAKELLAAIERDGYVLRAINYNGQIAPTTAGLVLEQPDEHWTFWLAK